MGPQEPPLFELNNNSTPEEQLAAVLTEEQRLQKCWLEAADKVEKSKYQAQLKKLIQTRQALKSKNDASASQHDNPTPEERLALVLTEEKRLQKFDLGTASNAEKFEYLAQLRALLQTKQALETEIDTASSQQALQEQQRQEEQQQSHNKLSVENPIPADDSTNKSQQPKNKTFYKAGISQSKDKTKHDKSLALAITLLATVSVSVFISQNDADIQAPAPEPVVEQKPAQQLESVQEKKIVQPQTQISSLESDIRKLIIRLNKKESDFKENLEAASNEVQKLIGKIGHGTAKIKLSEQQAIYALSQLAITTNNRLVNLQQKKTATILLIEQKQYQAAIEALKEIKQGYQNLLANLNKAKSTYIANNDTLGKQGEWLDFKRKHELGALDIESNANTLLHQANTARDTGRLTRAFSNYKSATQAYHDLLTGPDAQEAIAAKNRQQIIAQIKNEMIKIPLGDFRMGDINGNGDINEHPVHKVLISSFALKKTEVTFEQYDIFADATDRTRPDDDGWGRGKQPVINVNWHDATAYSEWLSKQTGDQFRLPTEAEWEYAARAGHETKYSWGDTPSAVHANGSEEYGWPADGYIKQTAPVATYEANDFGIHDMQGNVQEWTQDCWNFNYQGASLSGKASTNGDCEKRILRGGSWADIPSMLRSSKRHWSTTNVKSSISGFRLVQELNASKKMRLKSSQKDSAATE